MQGSTHKRMSLAMPVRDVVEGQLYTWDATGVRLRPINPGAEWHPDFRTKAQVTQKTLKASGRAPSTADKFHIWDDVASEFKWIAATHILAKQLSDYTSLASGESLFSFDSENAITGADDTYHFEVKNHGSGCFRITTNDTVELVGGNWNTGYLKLGDARLWYDHTNNVFRYKDSANPSSETDGTQIPGAGGGGSDVHVGADASPPASSEPIWLVTDGGPFGTGSMRVSFDGGTTYKETGIVFS